jgi:FtsZ-interacting cell division protein ZipA
LDPPTLSLPVVGSGPEIARRRGAEPTVSDFDSLQLTRSDEFAKVGDFQVPRLDTPASKPDARTSKLDAPGANSDAAPAFGAAAHSKPIQARDNRINLEDTHVGGDSAERAFNQAVFGDSSMSAGNADEPHTRTDVLSEAGPTFNAQTEARTQFLGGAAAPAPAPASDAPPAVPRFTASDVTPIADPIVEWPPDDQRRVIAVRLVASPSERFAGRALRLALASEGFVLGKFQIFHKPDDNGRAVLSAANLSKPGTFDTATMDSQRYGGLSLFIVLPGPRPSLKAFEDLLTTARNLNERLQGALQDERGGPLTPTRIASLRDSLAPGSAGVESETPP